ncbi:MAG: hypothetical protein HXX10_07485 [Rhodoplanes sp.]|uniref:hypothetical protein n=1 Tax=Rhodoplanes sp. TaxID=1968906 RepID=UPI0017CAC550|nr:hypothetical protein [Rhodoplanes sp.]NVO13862.1 hypothetical protein [Rhodoplanes sp.]
MTNKLTVTALDVEANALGAPIEVFNMLGVALHAGSMAPDPDATAMEDLSMPLRFRPSPETLAWFAARGVRP